MSFLAVLRGGSRNGESTEVADAVGRLYAPSDAPGMLDVYEVTDETAPVRGNEEPGIVFVFVGQEAATGIAPEAIHMPPGR